MIRRIKKHFLKLFFGAILVTVAFLFFFLRSDFVADKVYTYTLSYLEENLRSDINIGKPELNWLRGSFYISDVSIRPGSGNVQKEFITAKGVRVSFLPLWNLLKMEIGIKSVEIEEPAVYVRIEKGKIANLPSFDFLKGEKGLFNLNLREVVVSKGSLALSDSEMPSEVTVNKIDMKIKPEFDKKHFGFSIANAEANIKVREFSHRIKSLKGDFSINPHNLTIIKSAFILQEGKISLEGLYLDFGALKWETRVSSELDLPAFKKSIVSGRVPGAGNDIKEQLVKRNISGTANITASLKGTRDSLEASGGVKSDVIELDGFKIKEIKSTFSTKARLDSLKESPFEIELWSNIPVEMLSHYVEKTPRLKGAVDVHIKCSKARGQWGEEKLKIDGDVASPMIEMAGTRANKVSAKFYTDLSTLRIEEMTAGLFGGVLKGSSDIDLGDDKGFKGQFDFNDVDLSDLRKPGEPNKNPQNTIAGRASGSVTVSGNMTPELSMVGSSTSQLRDISFKGGSFSSTISAAELKTSVSYTGGVTAIKSMEIDTPASKASVSGEISGRKLSLDLNINSSDIKELTGNIKGTGTIKAKITGEIQAPSLYGNIQLNRLSWNGYNTDMVSGNIWFKEQTLISKGLSLKHGSSEMFFKGEISLAKESPWINAVVEMEKGRLEDISSMTGINLPIKGNVSFSGDVNGEIRSLSGDISIEGSQMTVAGEYLDSLTLTGRLERGRLILHKAEISRDNDKVNISGNIDTQGEMHLIISSSRIGLGNLTFIKRKDIPVDGALEFTGKISGNMRNPLFIGQGSLTDVVYRNFRLGRGNIEVAVIDRVMNIAGNMFGFKINSGIMLKTGYPFQLTIDAEELSLAPYFKGADSLEGLSGVLSGSFKADGELSNVDKLWARGFISKLQLERELFQVKNVNDIEVELKSGKISFNSFKLSGKGTELNTSGWIGLDGEAALFIDGNIDLYLLRVLARGIEKGEGVADIKLAVSGKPGRVEGTIAVRNGLIVFKGFEPVFRNIFGAAVLNGKTLTVEDLTGRIGEGTFKGSGVVEMAGLNLKRTDLLFDVVGLRLAFPKWLPGEVEGNLRLTGEYPLLLLSGDVNVVNARYSEVVDWATLIPSFKQRLKEPAAMKKESGALSFDINFNAERNLIFDNNVGKGELKGSIKLKGDTSRIGLVGTVEVITGTVSYKEHEFKIVSGIIEFPDPKKIEAVLDFTAEGKVRDYIIQIQAQGNINDLKVTMTSSPTLSELDIASLLSVGLTSKEFLETGVTAPAYEAASIISREVEGRFKGYIGFDRFHIDPYYSNATGTTEPKLTVGKDISEDVMVIYSRGLSGTGEQEAQLEYKLFGNISVMGGWSSFGASESGDLGADMKVRFEFR